MKLALEEQETIAIGKAKTIGVVKNNNDFFLFIYLTLILNDFLIINYNVNYFAIYI